MIEPLNPMLYNRLQRLYGRVLIANPGQAAVLEPQPNPASARIILRSRGESYRIDCPFCPGRGAVDSRARLWINHRWGIGFPEYGYQDRMWWAAKCFNEDCLAEPVYRELLRDRVYSAFGRDAHLTAQIRPGEIVSETLEDKQLPGDSIPLKELPDAHPARMYLRQRGWDPDVVATLYDLRYCERVDDARMWRARGRLIIPFYQDGRLVGWQGRFIGSHRPKMVPKYYTCPGMMKHLLLYDYDRALLSPVVFIVEGVTDVWAVGRGAVALCGKTLSYVQERLILQHWKAAVILLDHDAADAADDIYGRLAVSMPTVNVQLPPRTDPASCDREFLWAYIDGCAKRQNIDLLSFGTVDV